MSTCINANAMAIHMQITFHTLCFTKMHRNPDGYADPDANAGASTRRGHCEKQRTILMIIVTIISLAFLSVASVVMER